MKKFLTMIFTLALVAVFALTGCTEYKPPTSAEKPGSSTDDPSNPGGPSNPDKPMDYSDCFTVTLNYLGSQFVPSSEVYAQWSDGMSVTRAKFGADGVAKTSELDGDYVVTLSAAPNGYTYEPNIYTATNDSRNTTITLYKINSFSNNNDGSDFFDNIITLPSTGAYRVTFTKPNQIIYFSLTPKTNGVYKFQSLIDVTANEVNPVLYRYSSPQLDTVYEKYDGGGSANTYTKNFIYTVKLSNLYVGNDFKFSIQAESIKKEAFPINIDFLLERDGEYSEGSTGPLPEVVPVEDFKYDTEGYPREDITGKTFKLAADYNGKIQNSNLFELCDDGYYHVKGTGEMLYASISGRLAILGDDADNKNYLTYEEVLYRLKYDDRSYIEFIKTYAQHVNADGVYPVTEELREFLQLHSVKCGYFKDGNGNAEIAPLYYTSGEDDQWLWACGYYS